MTHPKISVIVPTRNAETTIPKQIQALMQQVTSSETEFLLVDNGSTDGTKDFLILATMQDHRFSYVPAFEKTGISYARNEGIKASLGDFILFCDADDEVQPGWLSTYEQIITNGADLVGGTLITKGQNENDEILGLNYSLWELPFPAGANCGVKKSVAEILGLFDESIAAGEDADFFWRAQLKGFKLTFVPEAKVNYVRRETTSGLWKQQIRNGRAQVLLFKVFKNQGMPKIKTVRSLFSWSKALMELISPFIPPSKRTLAVGRIALHTGRALESFKSRTWYL